MKSQPWRRSPLCLLPLLGVLVMPVVTHAREGTEWSTAYWYNANETALPRVLLVGDSITNGYQSLVKDKLAGSAYVSFWASSKCVTDATYLKALAFMLEEYPYAVIHFNNGLHSLGTDPKAWEAGLRAAFDLLKAKASGAKIVWVSSTPLKDPELTAKAKVLNEIGARVAAEYGFPVDDLFTLMDPQDRNKLWSDTFHYTAEGRDMEATQVASFLRPLLPAPTTPAPAAAGGSPAVKNGDFEAEGGWQLYPPKPDRGTLELTSEGAHGGKRAAKVTALQGGLQFHQYAPVLTPGATYHLSFWARADKPAKVTTHVRTQKPPYVYYGNQEVELTTEWQQFGTDLTVPAEYKPGDHVLFFNLSGAGTYWFDDVVFERK